MSEQTNSFTRRQFLKGAAYTSVLSIGGLSTLASAKSISDAQPMAEKAEIIGTPDKLSINIANQSDRIVALDPEQPVSLEKVNGWIVVKVNKAKPSSGEVAMGQQMVLSSGQQCTFLMDGELASLMPSASAHIVITNEFSTLDNMLPMAHYNSMVA